MTWFFYKQSFSRVAYIQPKFKMSEESSRAAQNALLKTNTSFTLSFKERKALSNTPHGGQLGDSCTQQSIWFCSCG